MDVMDCDGGNSVARVSVLAGGGGFGGGYLKHWTLPVDDPVLSKEYSGQYSTM